MGYKAQQSLENNMIELKMVSRQMLRSTKKCEKREQQALAKLKKVRNTTLRFALNIFPYILLWIGNPTRKL